MLGVKQGLDLGLSLKRILAQKRKVRRKGLARNSQVHGNLEGGEREGGALSVYPPSPTRATWLAADQCIAAVNG